MPARDAVNNGWGNDIYPQAAVADSRPTASDGASPAASDLTDLMRSVDAKLDAMAGRLAGLRAAAMAAPSATGTEPGAGALRLQRLDVL